MFAPQLRAHQQHKTHQVRRCLLQHVDRHRVARVTQVADCRRQRRKIRPRRAVAQVHQVLHRRRAPNLAHFLENLRRLFAIVCIQSPPHGVQTDPVARSLIAQVRTPSARAFPASIRRAPNRVRAGPGDLQNPRPSLKSGIQGDHLVAHNLASPHPELIEYRRDPLVNSGHAGACHAARCRANTRDSRLRIDLLEDRAQMFLRSLLAHPQALDRSIFSKRQYPPAIDDRGARPRASAVNSQHYAHLVQLLLLFELGPAVAQGSGQNIQASIGL